MHAFESELTPSLSPCLPSTLQAPLGTINMCVFKLYLGHILGTCDQREKVAALSGPLQLYRHQPRSQVGRVLMATPDLGSPAPYIPTFYQECSSIIPRANHEVSVYKWEGYYPISSIPTISTLTEWD